MNHKIIIAHHHRFLSEGFCLNPVCINFSLNKGSLNLITVAFSSSFASSLFEAVETQLACHCFSYAFCLKIAHTSFSLPLSAAGKSFEVQAFLKAQNACTKCPHQKKPPKNIQLALRSAWCFWKGIFLMLDPLFVCSCMVGRKRRSHFHRGLLYMLEHTIISCV